MPPKGQLKELTWFKRDKETTSEGKNTRLAELLQGEWMPLAIVRIDRIEIADRGWRATYRT